MHTTLCIILYSLEKITRGELKTIITVNLYQMWPAYEEFKGQFKYLFVTTVERRFIEPLYNEVPCITNDILQPGQSYSEMHETELH